MEQQQTRLESYVPFDEMPFLFNPEKGYFNGNNKAVDDHTHTIYLDIGQTQAGPNKLKRIDTIINSKRRWRLLT